MYNTESKMFIIIKTKYTGQGDILGLKNTFVNALNENKQKKTVIKNKFCIFF